MSRYYRSSPSLEFVIFIFLSVICLCESLLTGVDPSNIRWGWTQHRGSGGNTGDFSGVKFSTSGGTATWSRLISAYPVYAGPLYSARLGLIYVGTMEGVIHAIISGCEEKEIWSTSLNGAITSTPVLDSQEMVLFVISYPDNPNYLKSKGIKYMESSFSAPLLYAINATDGTFLWNEPYTFPLPSPTIENPKFLNESSNENVAGGYSMRFLPPGLLVQSFSMPSVPSNPLFVLNVTDFLDNLTSSSVSSLSSLNTFKDTSQFSEINEAVESVFQYTPSISLMCSTLSPITTPPAWYNHFATSIGFPLPRSNPPQLPSSAWKGLGFGQLFPVSQDGSVYGFNLDYLPPGCSFPADNAFRADKTSEFSHKSEETSRRKTASSLPTPSCEVCAAWFSQKGSRLAGDIYSGPTVHAVTPDAIGRSFFLTGEPLSARLYIATASSVSSQDVKEKASLSQSSSGGLYCFNLTAAGLPPTPPGWPPVGVSIYAAGFPLNNVTSYDAQKVRSSRLLLYQSSDSSFSVAPTPFLYFPPYQLGKESKLNGLTNISGTNDSTSLSVDLSAQAAPPWAEWLLLGTLGGEALALEVLTSSTMDEVGSLTSPSNLGRTRVVWVAQTASPSLGGRSSAVIGGGVSDGYSFAIFTASGLVLWLDVLTGESMFVSQALPAVSGLSNGPKGMWAAQSSFIRSGELLVDVRGRPYIAGTGGLIVNLSNGCPFSPSKVIYITIAGLGILLCSSIMLYYCVEAAKMRRAVGKYGPTQEFVDSTLRAAYLLSKRGAKGTLRGVGIPALQSSFVQHVRVAIQALDKRVDDSGPSIFRNRIKSGIGAVPRDPGSRVVGDSRGGDAKRKKEKEIELMSRIAGTGISSYSNSRNSDESDRRYAPIELNNDKEDEDTRYLSFDDEDQAKEQLISSSYTAAGAPVGKYSINGDYTAASTDLEPKNKVSWLTSLGRSISTFIWRVPKAYDSKNKSTMLNSRNSKEMINKRYKHRLSDDFGDGHLTHSHSSRLDKSAGMLERDNDDVVGLPALGSDDADIGNGSKLHSYNVKDQFRGSSLNGRVGNDVIADESSGYNSRSGVSFRPRRNDNSANSTPSALVRNISSGSIRENMSESVERSIEMVNQRPLNVISLIPTEFPRNTELPPPLKLSSADRASSKFIIEMEPVSDPAEVANTTNVGQNLNGNEDVKERTFVPLTLLSEISEQDSARSLAPIAPSELEKPSGLNGNEIRPVLLCDPFPNNSNLDGGDVEGKLAAAGVAPKSPSAEDSSKYRPRTRTDPLVNIPQRKSVLQPLFFRVPVNSGAFPKQLELDRLDLHADLLDQLTTDDLITPRAGLNDPSASSIVGYYTQMSSNSKPLRSESQTRHSSNSNSDEAEEKDEEKVKEQKKIPFFKFRLFGSNTASHSSDSSVADTRGKAEGSSQSSTVAIPSNEPKRIFGIHFPSTSSSSSSSTSFERKLKKSLTYGVPGPQQHSPRLDAPETESNLQRLLSRGSNESCEEEAVHSLTTSLFPLDTKDTQQITYASPSYEPPYDQKDVVKTLTMSDDDGLKGSKQVTDGLSSIRSSGSAMRARWFQADANSSSNDGSSSVGGLQRRTENVIPSYSRLTIPLPLVREVSNPVRRGRAITDGFLSPSSGSYETKEGDFILDI